MTLRIGLVGVGDWGRHILRDLVALGAEVHAVARSEASIARARAAGVAAIHADVAALPADCAGFVVAAIETAHLDIVEALLPRGCPIYVEKPLSSDLARIRRLPPAAADRVFVMHKWRYHPGILELARIAATEEFGPVTGISARRLGFEHHHHDTDAIWVLLPHDLSIALHVLGEVPVPVAAWTDPTTRPGESLLLRAEARGGRVPVQIHVSSGHPNKSRSTVLAARDAVCELDDSRYDTVVIRRRGTLATAAPTLRSVAADMPLERELAAFLAHCAGGPPPMSSLADEIAILEAIVAARALAGG